MLAYGLTELLWLWRKNKGKKRAREARQNLEVGCHSYTGELSSTALADLSYGLRKCSRAQKAAAVIRKILKKK
jgi:hypothetical protein